MTRPLCPQCQGARVVKVGGSRTTTMPCSSCDDGTMRGIDDPTPEERRIAELAAKVGALDDETSRLRAAFTKAHTGHGCEGGPCWMRATYEESLSRAESDRAGGGR
jgi:hypothetical protein